MGSRGPPPRSISELVALSEVDEESYEDLDRLLDITTNTDNFGNNDEDDSENLFDTIEIPSSIETSHAIASESFVSSSSPLNSLHTKIYHNPLTAFNDTNTSLMSPTTLLDNILSHSNNVDIDQLSQKNVPSDVLSFSMDMYTNANMDFSQSMDVTNNNIDTSLFHDVDNTLRHDEIDRTLNNTMIENNSDDGMNSFVTAREDGDATLTINSKESTVVTAIVLNKSSSDDFGQYHENELTVHPLSEDTTENNMDATNDNSRTSQSATIDQQITATVSFHQSTDELEQHDHVAPLWEEDPSTPKRSGREILLLTVNNDKPHSDSTTIRHDTDIVLQTECTTGQPNRQLVHLSPPSSDNNPVLDQHRITETETLYASDSIVSAESALVGRENEEQKQLVPVPDQDLIITAKKSTLDRLSVPSLSDDNKPTNNYLVPNNTPKEIETITIEQTAEKEGRHDDKEVNCNDIATNKIISIAASHQTTTLSVDEAPAAIRVSDTDQNDSCQQDQRKQVSQTEGVETSKLDNNNNDIMNTDNIAVFGSLQQDVHRRSNSELKSLQVEFSSRLDKGHKKSDVSLSSASSTISHGSFNKVQVAKDVYKQAPVDELQHRRNNSNDSLPPRSPMRINNPMDNQNINNFVTSKLVSQSVDNDENTGQSVETKWIKQPFSVSFNPRSSIFAGKQDTKGRSNSISPPGSPPEPCYSDSDDDNMASLQDDTRSSSSTSIKMNSDPGLWDMIIDEVWENEFLSKSKFTARDDEKNGPNQLPLRKDDSVSTSTVSPSEVERMKYNVISAKPSFHSDISISSSVIKRTGTNKTMSISQHSRGSLCSGRSSHERKGSRPLLSPIGRSRHNLLSSRRVESDTLSLGRLSVHPPKSPEPTTVHSMHCSSPDLYKLNEESLSSQQPSPTKIINATAPAVSRKDVNSFSDDAPSSDILSPDSLAEKFAAFERKDIMQYEESAAHLEKLLLEFSSIQPIELPFGKIELPLHLKYIGYVVWRQLIACWKHSELLRDMVSNTLSTAGSDSENENSTDVEMKSALSDRYQRSLKSNVELNGVSLKPKYEKTGARLFNGCAPNRTRSTISSFLTQLQSGTFNRSSNILRHEIATTDGNEVTVQLLHQTAQKNLTIASSIIQDIIAFASLNSTNRNEIDWINHSLCVKDLDSINRKAQMKYGGDILQVKDILRGQITFRNEGELVCGLVRLLQTAKISTNENKSNSADIALVRIKNLFFRESIMGDIATSSLPTAYRHVLLNLRFIDGLLFGKF
jgi:hypothetical protein